MPLLPAKIRKQANLIKCKIVRILIGLMSQSIDPFCFAPSCVVCVKLRLKFRKFWVFQ